MKVGKIRENMKAINKRKKKKEDTLKTQEKSKEERKTKN